MSVVSTGEKSGDKSFVQQMPVNLYLPLISFASNLAAPMVALITNFGMCPTAHWVPQPPLHSGPVCTMSVYEFVGTASCVADACMHTGSPPTYPPRNLSKRAMRRSGSVHCFPMRCQRITVGKKKELALAYDSYFLAETSEVPLKSVENKKNEKYRMSWT